MSYYATSTDVSTFLRTVMNVIRVGTGTDADLSNTDLNTFIDMAEGEINAEIQSISTPVNTDNSIMAQYMKNLTIYKSACVVWDAVAQGNDPEVPEKVLRWCDKSKEMIAKINNKQVKLVGQTQVLTPRPYCESKQSIFNQIGIEAGKDQFDNDILREDHS